MKREIAIDPAELTFDYELSLAGGLCRLQTNSSALGESLRRWWGPPQSQTACGHFTLQVLVTAQERSGLEPPHFRGLRHLVVASFGDGNVITLNLLRRSVSAVVTQELAAKQSFWDRVLLPMALGVLGPAIGIVPVHCACLAVDNLGILIAGASGAGKSTLAVALAQQGLTYISDDWTYLSLCEGQLVAHGLGVPAKLLPDAVEHFPHLQQYPLGLALNSELAYELPVEEWGAQVDLSSKPRWFLFLERADTEQFHLLPSCGDAIRRYLEVSLERLPPELTEINCARHEVSKHASRLSSWELRYGGSPRLAAGKLHTLLVDQIREVPA